MSRCATNLPWGYQDVPISYNQVPSPEEQLQQQQFQQQQQQQQQYANLPAALLNTLKREKKPFTYTPGGVNLSEVLEARLQKRKERKKKYMEEMEQEQQEQQERRPMLVVAPTYNTPLNMYSMENALETLEVQAQMAANRSSSATLPRNYKFKFQDDEDIEPPQSKAFRVLQVMTDTDSYPGSRKQKDSPPMSEMRWTGLKEVKSTNPSRFFHTLQKITGTDADEEQDTQENTYYEKRAAPAPTHAAPMHAAPSPAAPMHPTAPARAPAPLQHQSSFGSVPKLKRPAAFLPKQQPWSYYRMPAVTPVGTDF